MMAVRSSRWAVFVVAALSFASHAVAADVCASVPGNLVANCGFETGSFASWTLGGNLSPVLSDQGVDTADAWSGTYGAYLHAATSPTTLSQSIATANGDKYMVTLWAANDAPADPATGYLNSLVASFGLGHYSLTNQDIFGYQAFSFVGEAYGTSTNLMFALQNDAGYYSFDTVSVVLSSVAPEPGSLLLIAPALGGLLCWRLRRRQARVS